MRPPIDLAVTSPALPENSPNAMDGMTFILQFLVAAADSDTNIQNIFNITISIYCDILSLVLLEIISEGNQERNPLVLRPISCPRINQNNAAMHLKQVSFNSPLMTDAGHRNRHDAVR